VRFCVDRRVLPEVRTKVKILLDLTWRFKCKISNRVSLLVLVGLKSQ
jgi:hypothetical protein